MAQYSYKGAEPTELPARLTSPAEQSPSGERETRTHLDKLSDDELLELGIVRVEPVVYDSKEYDCIWNSSEVRYDLVELDERKKQREHLFPNQNSSQILRILNLDLLRLKFIENCMNLAHHS